MIARKHTHGQFTVFVQLLHVEKLRAAVHIHDGRYIAEREARYSKNNKDKIKKKHAGSSREGCKRVACR